MTRPDHRAEPDAPAPTDRSALAVNVGLAIVAAGWIAFNVWLMFTVGRP